MKKSAFTLIELLVVIAIIAILAGISLPIFGKILEKGKLVTDSNNLRQIGIGLQAYQNDNDGKMPPDSANGLIINDGAATHVIFDYTGKSYSVWHSKFDPRSGAEGAGYPVSYAFNSKILTPATPATAGQWAGDFGRAVVSTSKLIVASPCFAGTPTVMTSWTNTAAINKDLPDKGVGMLLQGNFYKIIPVLFADSHIDQVKAASFHDGQGTEGAGATSDYIEWDPMNPVAGAAAGGGGGGS